MNPLIPQVELVIFLVDIILFYAIMEKENHYLERYPKTICAISALAATATAVFCCISWRQLESMDVIHMLALFLAPACYARYIADDLRQYGHIRA